MYDRLAISSLVVVALGACADPSENESVGASSSSDLTESARPPTLPQVGAAPWGGPDASRWRSEAVIANAASAALNDAWSEPSTRDAIAAVPVTMLGSEIFPYGDGQSNASPSFGGWLSAERPPVVATWIRTDASLTVVIRLDRMLPTNATQATIRFRGATLDVSLELEPTGDRVGRFKMPFGFGPQDPFAVVPAGWRAGFPVSFLHPIKRAASLGVADLLDRAGVSVADERNAPAGTVDGRLRTGSFAARYNNQGPGVVAPYVNTEVHATFPASSRMVRTGVGGGRTWVFDERPRGYKTMYQCFDGRAVAAEAAAPNGGVPSATGWHAVGDKAETAVNDLEAAPMVVGFATRGVLGRNEVGPDGFAWNLDTVATMRWLRPGEALVSPRGTLHWFGFAHAAPACLEIVVSPEHAPLAGFEP